MYAKFWITDAQFERLKADGKVRQAGSREAIFFQGHEETQFGIIRTGAHNIVEPGQAAKNSDIGIDEPDILVLPGTILPERAGPKHPAWALSGHAASTYPSAASPNTEMLLAKVRAGGKESLSPEEYNKLYFNGDDYLLR